MKPPCDPWEPEQGELDCELCRGLSEPWFMRHCAVCGREVCLDCQLDLVEPEPREHGECICVECAQVNIDELNEAVLEMREKRRCQ